MKTFLYSNRKAPSPLFFSWYSKLLIIALVALGLTAFVPTDTLTGNSTLMSGVVFEIETTNHSQPSQKTESMEVMVEGRNISIQVLPNGRNGRGRMIFNASKGKKGNVFLTDDDKKEYYVIDDAFIDKMAGNVNTSKGMMEKAMEGLSPEQRKMIEEAQKKSGNKMPGFPSAMKLPSKPEILKTDEKANKNGYSCTKYEVHRDGKKIRELWITSWKNIDGGNEAKNAFAAMNTFFEDMKDMFGAGGFPGGSNPYNEMVLVDGFPVVVNNFNEVDGSLEDESILKSTKRRTLDPADFEPPSGYKRRSMMPN